MFNFFLCRHAAVVSCCAGEAPRLSQCNLINRHIFFLALMNHIIKLDILEWHQNKKKNNSLKKKTVNKQSQEIFTEMKELILMSVDNR